MQINPLIFKAYDIRGLLQPDEITTELAYAIGRGVMATVVGNTKSRVVVVGRDARPSSPEITKELIRGLRDGGADVVDIGMTTTPLFYYSVIQTSAAGGIMVTASHNPAEYNGFKIVKSHAVAIGLESGLDRLRDYVIRGDFGSAAPESSFTEDDFSDRYIDAMTHGTKIKKFRVAIDAGNGMIGIILPRVLGRLGIEARVLYQEPDGTFPNHEANPLKEETLRDLQAVMREHPVDFGIAYDGDGDRIRFLLRNGTPVPGDIMLALLTKEYLSTYPGSAIVYAANCSRNVPETIEAYGGKAIRWKIGHTLIKQKMLETGAILGGEISTHTLYREIGTVESTVLTLVRVCQILTRQSYSLNEVVKPFWKYAKIPETNFTIDDRDTVLKRLADRYKDAKLDWLDGLTAEYDTWWFNARPSNTEPVLRLCLEAETLKMMEEKLAEVQGVILQH